MRPNIDLPWSVHGRVKEYAETESLTLTAAYQDILRTGLAEATDLPRLSFAEEYVTDIVTGEKTATVRYRDADHLDAGDTVVFETAENTREFATATITKTATVSAIDAAGVLLAIDANYPADSPEAVIEGVNRHYDTGIAPSTTVRVIAFEVSDDGE